jgi:hypothetical protein
MSATAHRARSSTAPKADSLRSTPVGAIWPGLPARDRHLLLWLLSGDIVTARLAAVLVHGQLGWGGKIRTFGLPIQSQVAANG